MDGRFRSHRCWMARSTVSRRAANGTGSTETAASVIRIEVLEGERAVGRIAQPFHTQLSIVQRFCCLAQRRDAFLESCEGIGEIQLLRLELGGDGFEPG